MDMNFVRIKGSYSCEVMWNIIVKIMIDKCEILPKNLLTRACACTREKRVMLFPKSSENTSDALYHHPGQ